MNEAFIQIMDKLNEELQLHVKYRLCHNTTRTVGCSSLDYLTVEP
jgi:hypothetical protein